MKKLTFFFLLHIEGDSILLDDKSGKFKTFIAL